MHKLLKLLFLCVLSVVCMHAQSRQPANFDGPQGVSVGGYFDLGLASAGQPIGRRDGMDAMIGIQTEWLRGRWGYGADARFAGQSLGDSPDDGCCLAGTTSQQMFGPRTSYSFGSFHPYAEVLLGHAKQSDTPQPDNLTTQTNSGFGMAGAIGADFDRHEHWRFRAEYSASSLVGKQGFLVQTFTFGWLLHFR